jgi:sugar lactone lactonase YvrE
MDNVWPIGAELGEGPVWFDDALWFVDIKAPAIHRFEPATGAKRSWSAPQQVGFLFPARSGGFVAGLQSGLHRFDPDSGAFDLICEVDADKPGNRLNDGAVDLAGRLWFGSMADDERQQSGAYHCFDQGRLTRTHLTGIAITNGPAISPDGCILYWVDTLRGTIEACDIAEDGSLGMSRPFARIDPKDGHPDGPCVDAEGCVWISLFGGWAAWRFSPAGERVGQVRFPVANITKIAFGGPRLRTGYATTAKLHLSADQRAEQSDAGDLFAFDAGVAGVPCNLVNI